MVSMTNPGFPEWGSDVDGVSFCGFLLIFLKYPQANEIMGVLPMHCGQSVKASHVPMLHFSVDGAGPRLQKGAVPGRARGHFSLL